MSFDFLGPDPDDPESGEKWDKGYECWNCGNSADAEATAQIPDYGIAHLCDACWPQRFSLSAFSLSANLPPTQAEEEG